MEICNGTYCVYIHTNKIDGKMYVGQTCQNPQKRWAGGSKYKGSTYFYKAIKKYGWDNFEHEIVASNLTSDEANHFEELLISQLDTMNPKYGYNLKSGGENNLLSEETKHKISQAASLRTSDKNPFFGKHHTESLKQQMSKTKQGMFTGNKNPNYGKTTSDEVKQKISNGIKKAIASDEMKTKLSANNTKEKNPMARKINQYDKNEIFICTWFCIASAADALMICAQNISRCAKGIRPTAGGFVWYYADDPTQPDKTKIITKQND